MPLEIQKMMKIENIKISNKNNNNIKIDSEKLNQLIKSNDLQKLLLEEDDDDDNNNDNFDLKEMNTKSKSIGRVKPKLIRKKSTNINKTN